MKKIYTLGLMLAFAISFVSAQDPAPIIFSEYIEGSSNNKALEIHNPNDVAVDLARYEIVQASNGGGWEFYHSFPQGATIEPGDVWVIITDETDSMLYDPAGADEVLSYPSVVHHNGNDARGLIFISDIDTIFLDVIGIPDEDPGNGWNVAGIDEATKEHTLVRKSHILTGNLDWTASAGTDIFNSEWIVYDQDFIDSLGIHTYAPFMEVTAINLTAEGGVAEISVDKGLLQINAEIVPMDATYDSLSWSVSDITLASVTQDGMLTAINDGVVTVTVTALDGSGITGTIDITNSNQTPVIVVTTINVTGEAGDTTITENGGSLQLFAEVLPADATDPSITWSVDDTTIATLNETALLTAKTNGTVTVTVTANDGFGGSGTLDVVISNQVKEVANLSELKTMDASDQSTVYKITGEVLLTFQQSYRSKKYVQDENGGLEIDDNPGNITTAYNLGDGISGLMGTLEDYNGLLQIHPVSDPGEASSTGNSISPQVLSVADLKTDHDSYESKLVSLENVTFSDADGTAVFANGSNYNISDGVETVICRVHFYDTPLTGTVIPNLANVTGLVLEYEGEVQVSPRSADDVEKIIGVGMAGHATKTIEIYPVPAGNYLHVRNVESVHEIRIVSITGSVLEVYELSGENHTELDISHLVNGIYFLKMSSIDSFNVIRFLKD